MRRVQDDVIKEGIDHAELCVAALPRPVLIGTATRDFFPIEGAREAFAFTRQIYALHGAAERVGLAVADSEHGFQPEHRKAVVQWFRRWLGGETDPAAHKVVDDHAPAGDAGHLGEERDRVGRVDVVQQQRAVRDIDGAISQRETASLGGDEPEVRIRHARVPEDGDAAIDAEDLEGDLPAARPVDHRGGDVARTGPDVEQANRVSRGAGGEQARERALGELDATQEAIDPGEILKVALKRGRVHIGEVEQLGPVGTRQALHRPAHPAA